MEISLEGKVALVTGASKGIGKAIAGGFAEPGAKVMLSSRKQDQLEAAAAEIDAARRRCSPPTPATSTPPAACVDGDDRALRRARHPRQQRRPPTRTTAPRSASTPARYDKTFEVNLRGPLFWCQAAWEQAFEEQPGVIINIASVGGLRAEFGLGVYNLTKAALIHLTRQLAGELGPTRVVGIAPGLVQTDFAGVARRELRRDARRARCRRSGSASRRTSPTWRCSSPATRPAGSPARPT